MLPKSQRLNLKTDFKWVVAGQKKESSLFKIFLRVGENTLARVGIATSKNYFKKAHERNRARRLLSEALIDLYPRLNKELNLVIMPKTAILEKKPEQIREELEHVLHLNSNN